jgi:hypothetical protein
VGGEVGVASWKLDSHDPIVFPHSRVSESGRVSAVGSSSEQYVTVLFAVEGLRVSYHLNLRLDLPPRKPVTIVECTAEYHAHAGVHRLPRRWNPAGRAWACHTCEVSAGGKRGKHSWEPGGKLRVLTALGWNNDPSPVDRL